MTSKKVAKKKEVRYEYWFAFADNNNKLQNALADTKYQLDSREKILRAQEDIRRIVGGNFKAFYNFKLLRKKYITVESEAEKCQTRGTSL
jgi:hypothetical protein